MIPATEPLATIPLATIPAADSLATVSAESMLLGDPDAELVIIAETSPSGGTMLRLSDVGYITGASDSPAKTPYRDRLLDAYNVDTRIPLPGDATGIGELAFGLVEIENGDEALDDLLDDSWEGRDLALKVGGRFHVDRVTEGELSFSQFQTIQSATIASVSSADGMIILSLRERLQELATPIQQNAYSGTGGLEGDEGIKGLKKPRVIGEVFNWEPICVDVARRIYQWNDGPVNDLNALRDNGVELTDAGNVSDIEAAATPADGTYITQNSGGYIRLGAEPFGRITIDGEGDKTGGVYVSTVGNVALRIAELVGLTTADFESGSFSGFPDVGVVGIGVRSEESPTALDLLGALLAGVFGFVSQSRTGLLRIGRYRDPAASIAETTVTDDLISAIEETGTELPPVWKVEVGYGRNWSPQDTDALSDALSTELRELYSKPERIASAEDAAILAAHLDARVLRLSSHLILEEEAAALATYALGILGRRIRPIRIAVERNMFRRQPGSIVRIVSDYADLAAGRNYFVTSVAEDAASRLNTWELWG